jgi:DNA-binding response OmpR family regulator
LKGRSILIVDDDEDILSSIDLAMRSEGAATSRAVDGHAAVSTFNAVNPDAVVLDMMLPKRSGFLVLEKLMESADPPIVVMVTANQGKRHQVYAHNLGVHAYLTKPVPLHRLVDTVVRLLEGRPHRVAPPAPPVPPPPATAPAAAPNGD